MIWCTIYKYINKVNRYKTERKIRFRKETRINFNTNFVFFIIINIIF